MTPYFYRLATVALLSLTLASNKSVIAADMPSSDNPVDTLFSDILALDFAVFDSFNKCVEPTELKKHAEFFTHDVEFYHDTGGVTWNRQDMMANTQKYACGHYRRELVTGTMRVFPVKEFGAIVQGVHRFCHIETGSCDGLADFTIVWRQQDNQWKITRVLSYGHRVAEVNRH